MKKNEKQLGFYQFWSLIIVLLIIVGFITQGKEFLHHKTPKSCMSVLAEFLTSHDFDDKGWILTGVTDTGINQVYTWATNKETNIIEWILISDNAKGTHFPESTESCQDMGNTLKVYRLSTNVDNIKRTENKDK